jgi:type I restriction enzyme M protein
MAAKKNNENGLAEHRRQEVQQAVKNACDQLNSDGVAPRDYVEQLAWLFFLKAFDEAESRLEQEASFDDRPYVRLLDGQHRWSAWAKNVERPDEMLEFVDAKLWRYLQTFGVNKGSKEFADDPVAERFRRIFSSVRNHSRRGASFARVVQQVNRLHFSDETDVVVLSEIYEDLLKRVAGDSAGYAGEFYTQRHIIRAMVEVVQPKIGERLYDPCFGTAGFLAESAEYIRRHARALSGRDLDTLNQRTFFGVELKPLTYLLGIMNMLLHRIERANLEQANTLELHTANVSEKNKYNVILANPPYGGKLPQELQTNFTIRSGSTEILFLQHIMASLKKSGRAGVIVPEGVMFRGGADQKVRERLLTEFNLHTVLSLPAGCFLPYTPVKTNVLFFERRPDGEGTQSVWFFELTNDGFELTGSRKPIEGEQISTFVSLFKHRSQTEHSWLVPIEELRASSWDLSARNPNTSEGYEHRAPAELARELLQKEERVIEIFRELQELLAEGPGAVES